MGDNISRLKYHLQPTQYKYFSLLTNPDISTRHQGVIFTQKSITLSSFFDCQKHEDIAVRWRDEDITVPSFSLSYTWRNDLRLYNRMILAMMFIYSDIIVIWDLWILICHPPVSFVTSAPHRAQVMLLGGKPKTAGLKWQ